MKDIYELINNIEINENEFEEISVNDAEKEKFKNSILAKTKKKKVSTTKKFLGPKICLLLIK